MRSADTQPSAAGAPARLAFLLPDMRGGGAERVALTLIEALVARGHPVDLLLMEAKGELLPLVPDAVRVVDLHAPRIRSVFAPLIRYLRRASPAGLQISMWPLTVVGVVAARLARFRGTVVVSDHCVLSRQYPQPQVRRALAWSVRLIYPLASARVIVSRAAADDLAAFSRLSRDAIDVIYNPIPRPPPDDGAQVGWPARGVRLLTVGALKPEKNHALFLHAVARLAQRRDVQAAIVGEGDLRPQLTALAAELGIADRVALPGFTTNPWPWYRSADVFVLSSDYEGFGNVLVEALRCGLPVVSTDCPTGPAEILKDGQFGALTPVGDAQALADAIEAALKTTIDGDAQRDRAEVLSGEDVIQRYRDLLLPTAIGTR